MRYQEAIAELKSSVTPRTLTRAEKLEMVAKMFDKRSAERFNTFTHVERPVLFFMLNRKKPITGTLIEPVVEHLNASGVPTAPTIEGVRTSLELSGKQMNYFACYCHNGESVSGGSAAAALRTIASGVFV